MEYYVKHPGQRENIEVFKELVQRYDLKPYVANPVAPWHIKCDVSNGIAYPQQLNFWPHVLKGYWSGQGRSVQGAWELEEMIVLAFEYLDEIAEQHDLLVDELDDFK